MAKGGLEPPLTGNEPVELPVALSCQKTTRLSS